MSRYSVIWGSTAASPLANVTSERYRTLKSVMKSAEFRGGFGIFVSLMIMGVVFANPGRLNPPGYRWLCAAWYRSRAWTRLQRVDKSSGLWHSLFESALVSRPLSALLVRGWSPG